jgi:hypothetical protein
MLIYDSHPDDCGSCYIPFSLVDGYEGFGATSCLHLQFRNTELGRYFCRNVNTKMRPTSFHFAVSTNGILQLREVLAIRTANSSVERNE